MFGQFTLLFCAFAFIRASFCAQVPQNRNTTDVQKKAIVLITNGTDEFEAVAASNSALVMFSYDASRSFDLYKACCCQH